MYNVLIRIIIKFYGSPLNFFGNYIVTNTVILVLAVAIFIGISIYFHYIFLKKDRSIHIVPAINYGVFLILGIFSVSIGASSCGGGGVRTRSSGSNWKYIFISNCNVFYSISTGIDNS